MSLILPRLIDDLEGRIPRSSMIIIPGTTAEQKREFCALARQAEKFNFGNLPLEENPDNIIMGRPTWRIPTLTDVEIDAWYSGLIPLPAPVCWLEYCLGSSTSGILVRGESGKIQTMRVDYTKSGGQVFPGIWATEYKNGEERTILYAGVRTATRTYTAIGNDEQIEWLREFHRRDDSTGVLNLAQDNYLAMYLILMISSLSTEITREHIPEKLNRARVKSGHEPLPNHYVVNIVPGRFIQRREGKGSTHASPRLHWRRSHLRHFEHQTGNAKWLASENYRGTTGWWVTMIPRCLVGVAELGEVTHEYKVGA